MKVAVASRTFSKHPILRAELLEKFPDAIFNDEGLSLKGQSLIDYLQDMDGAILALEPVNDDVLSALPNLKIIGKYGVGFDKIDINALIKHQIRLGWTGGVNRRAVSELALTMIISLLRHVDLAGREIRAGHWNLYPGRELSALSVGLIGCGHIGKDLAKILRFLGCEVLVYDIVDYANFYTENGIKPVDLNTLLKTADVLSLHVPYNEKSHLMINAERLALMKESAILINTARGNLVDEDALQYALEHGRLAGAGFDVFAEEPPQNLSLLNLPNFMVTPHCGGSAENAILAMGRAAINGLTENRIPEIGVFPI